MKIDEAIILRDVDISDSGITSLFSTSQLLYTQVLQNLICDIVIVPKGINESNSKL